MKRSLDSPPARKEGNTPILSSLDAPVSPPRRRLRLERRSSSEPKDKAVEKQPPNLAAIEAGQVQVTDHLGVFSSRLSQCVRQGLDVPYLQVPDWVDLYRRNEHGNGRHFVIHQHDHPVAGPHYDLRLQFSETSSVSWSVMYGLPGDPNSRRVNRNATETRVHSYWNHVIETASVKTGSMLIWDTGEYEILPYQEQTMPETESDDSSSARSSSYVAQNRTENEKLMEAFHMVRKPGEEGRLVVCHTNEQRKIRLRLHGARLPPNYTIILRMDKTTQPSTPSATPHKRRRRTHSKPSRSRDTTSESSASPEPQTSAEEKSAEANEADHQIRMNNAYPGSINSIGSVHQRRWFITLDRPNSGFSDVPGSGPGKKQWIRKQNHGKTELMGFEPFYVRGPEVERSVVTGRLAKDILADEEVEGFIPRRGWRAVLE